jgi:hypothetical protein
MVVVHVTVRCRRVRGVLARRKIHTEDNDAGKDVLSGFAVGKLEEIPRS